MNHITTVDCLVLNNSGSTIKGLSFNVNAEITGHVLSLEQVVVDFSHGKKLLKDFIDGTYGLDHKAIAPSSFIVEEGEDFIVISSPALQAKLPKDAVFTYDRELFQYELFEEQIFFMIPSLLHEVATQFSSTLDYTTSNGEQVTVSVHLVPSNSFTLYEDNPNTASCMFHYCHGLPYSTSYGCQNLLHGHSSMLQFSSDLPFEENVNILTLLLHKVLSCSQNEQDPANAILRVNDGAGLQLVPNLYLVNKAHVTLANESIVSLTAETCTRGTSHLNLYLDNLENNATVILPSEPTVETFGAFLHDCLQEVLPLATKAPTNYTLKVSEGLTKGCIVRSGRK